MVWTCKAGERKIEGKSTKRKAQNQFVRQIRKDIEMNGKN